MRTTKGSLIHANANPLNAKTPPPDNNVSESRPAHTKPRTLVRSERVSSVISSSRRLRLFLSSLVRRALSLMPLISASSSAAVRFDGASL